MDNQKILTAILAVFLAGPLALIGTIVLTLFAGIFSNPLYGFVIGATIELIFLGTLFILRKKHWALNVIFWSAILAVVLGIGIALFLAGSEITSQAQLEASKTKMLIIGSSSREVLDILKDNHDTINYTITTPAELENDPTAMLANYDIVMLDQSEEANKEVSKKLGEAVTKFVKGGGSFILVKDSGIRRPDTPDVIGWQNTFGDIIPVECQRVLNSQPSCINKIIVRGKLIAQDTNSPIMQGIAEFPLEENLVATFETFDVILNGKEIAYLQSNGPDKRAFTGIAEKNLVLGKSIYFNYNPGKTRGIFEATLDYLK